MMDPFNLEPERTDRDSHLADDQRFVEPAAVRPGPADGLVVDDLDPLLDAFRVLDGPYYYGPWPHWLEVTPAFYGALKSLEREDFSAKWRRALDSPLGLPVYVVHDLPESWRFMQRIKLDEPPTELEIRVQRLAP